MMIIVIIIIIQYNINIMITKRRIITNENKVKMDI